MRSYGLRLALCLLFASPAGAQENPMARSRELAARGIEAYEQKDYTAFLSDMTAAAHLRPGHPTLLYNVAAGHALNGQTDAALDTLRVVVSMGVAFGAIAEDTDFASMAGTPAFQAILDGFEANAAPVGDASVAFSLPDSAYVPEGIAYDARDDAFYLGSVLLGRIDRVDRSGTAHPFVDSDSLGWSTLGLAIDPGRRFLWACRSALPQSLQADSGDVGRTGLFGYDLDSGRLATRILLSADSTGAFGDLAIDGRGTVYVSDSRSGVVYRVPAGATDLEVLVGAGTFPSPQGLALPPDGGALYIADYSRGIGRIDVASGRVSWLSVPNSATVLGIDGLAWDDGRLLAIQNGIRPHRLVRVSLDAAAETIVSVDVLVAGHPRFDEPTLGVVTPDAYYFVANSNWGHFDDNGALRDDLDHLPPVVLRVPR